MKTLYFADAESIHIAYSVDGDRYTGEVKLNLVATDPLVDVVIWSGYKLICEKGTTSWLGTPSLTVLISNWTGTLLSSTVSKNTSQLVANIPVVSPMKNDWANGSILMCRDDKTTDSTTSEVLSVTPLSSLEPIVWTFAFLTEMIFSWTVSKVPAESNIPCAVVDASLILFCGLSIRVNDLFPVRNDGFEETFGSGMKRLPRQDDA